MALSLTLLLPFRRAMWRHDAVPYQACYRRIVGHFSMSALAATESDGPDAPSGAMQSVIVSAMTGA